MYTGSLPPVSNAETWQDARRLIDSETGDNIIIDDCNVTLTVKEQNNGRAVLTGSSDGGEITFPEEGVFMWEFSVDQMKAFCAGTYDIGVRISRDGITRQLVIGTLTILDGIDKQ
jgi:hypothetical protein